MRLVVVLLLTLGAVGCGEDDELVGDWFDCGSGSAPDETCSSRGIHYGSDHTWADIDGSLEGSDPYCGSTEPGHHGTWSTDWMVYQVKIFRDTESGRSLEEITVTIDGNLMTRECIACPNEYWRRGLRAPWRASRSARSASAPTRSRTCSPPTTRWSSASASRRARAGARG